MNCENENNQNHQNEQKTDKELVQQAVELMRQNPRLTAGRACQRVCWPNESRLEIRNAIDYQIRKTLTNADDAEERVVYGGYQLCSCGELILNGTKALKMGTSYMHPACAKRTPAPEWKKLKRATAAIENPAKATRWKPEGASQKFIKMLGDYSGNLDGWTQERYDAEMNSVAGNGAYPKESQMNFSHSSDPLADESCDEDGEQLPYTGKRRNGAIYIDIKEYFQRADLGAVPRNLRLALLEVEQDVLRGERANLYVKWTPEQVRTEQKHVRRPFVDFSDQRSNVGLTYINGKLVDDLFLYEAEVDDSDVPSDEEVS